MKLLAIQIMGKYTTKTAVLTAPSKIEIQELEVPELEPKDILVRVKMAGICGSDIHLYSDTSPFGERRPWTYPTILGHENFGVIAEIGKDADAKDCAGMPLA